MEEKLSYQEFKDIVEGLRILSSGNYVEKDKMKLMKWKLLCCRFKDSVVMVSTKKKFPEDYMDSADECCKEGKIGEEAKKIEE